MRLGIFNKAPVALLAFFGLLSAEPEIWLSADCLHAEQGQTVRVVAWMKGGDDVKAYNLGIAFDSAAFRLKTAAAEAPAGDLKNALACGGRPILPLVKQGTGRINIAATTTGSGECIAGECVLGILILEAIGRGKVDVSLCDVQLLSVDRNLIECKVLSELTIIQGNVK